MADPINYTFYVNNSENITGSVANNTPGSDNLQNLHNGTWVIKLEATDDAGNSKNSTSITIYVDTAEPHISLSNPLNNQEINNTRAEFNFTVTDNMSPFMMCNLTISNGMYEYEINATDGVLQTVEKSGFISGTYYWNVTCVDKAGNINISETRNFTIGAPDIIITNNNITFNQSTFEEDDNITIYANIYNLGGIPAYNVTVQFWLGDPDISGTQINDNKTITELNVSDNFTVNIIYTPNMDINNIFVVVDPPTATNGSIIEENESNNKANKAFNVGLYNVYLGNTSELIQIDKPSINISLFTWDVSNATGSNIFITDIEAVPDFFSLQAIGLIAAGGPAAVNDFEDIDSSLGSTNYSDSVNNTYTSGGTPIKTNTYTVYSSNIVSVPVINSTNSSNFETGILWDTSDGGAEYNGSQDLVFISEINKGAQGGLGIYDFEIKIPALLRNYNLAGDNIAFYFEII